MVKKRVFRGQRKLGGFVRAEVWPYSTSEYELELRCLSGLLGV